MAGKDKEKTTRRGPAVDDEDAGRSFTDGLATPTGPAQPYDVEKVESDRAKSQAPRRPARP